MGSQSLNSEEISLESLNNLGKEQLARLVLEGCRTHPQFANRVERALAAASNPQSLISWLKKQLSALSRGKKFYVAGESEEIASEMINICQAITDELAPLKVDAAIELAERFLSLNRKVFERVDDSYGNIWPIFDKLLADLASFYQKSDSYGSDALAKKVFDWYCHNDYSVYDNIVEYFAPPLGNEGLAELERLLREQWKSTTRKPRSDYSTTHFLRGWLAIADARKDVDQYISILEQTGQAETVHYQVEIAERLVKIGRCQEALIWLDKVEDSPRFREEKRKLKIQVYEGLGNFEEAQTLRIEQFSASPSKTLYYQCLKGAEDADPLRERLLSAAFSHPLISQSLTFFIEVGECASAAALVLEKRQEWNGSNYHSLQPAAQGLENLYPLEASFLYRVLIDDILSRAQSKYYHHAVRYLKKLEALTPQIEEWHGLKHHQDYWAELQQAHKRKTAFWAKYKQ
jgi:hypothetical protein